MSTPCCDEIAGVWIPAWVFETCESPHTLLTYVVIAANQGDDGWPVSEDDLARHTGTHTARANATALQMESDGLISILPNKALYAHTTPPEARAAQELALLEDYGDV